MSEFQESHTISKLLGSPAGYVGYEDGSLLIKKLKANQNSVILLDEIEKAHPNIIKMFLQILEEAQITASNGESYNFSNNIILFTTNAGANSHIDKSMGFLTLENQIKQYNELKNVFPIEFINRLDNILYFNELSKNVLKQIIYKEIKNIIQLTDKNIDFIITDKAMNELIKNSYDKELGARKVKRVIEQKLKLKLARFLISNENINNFIIDYNKEYILK